MPGEFPIDVPILYVKKDSIIGVLSFLKTEQGFDYGFLADLTAIDEGPQRVQTFRASRWSTIFIPFPPRRESA